MRPLSFLIAACLAATAHADVGDLGAVSAVETLSRAEPQAVDVILQASRSENPNMRANAIEAMEPLPDRLLPLAQLGAGDPDRVVRYRALTAIGRLKFREMGPTAERHVDDPSPSVRAAAIFAAYECGRPVDVSAMVPLLTNPSPIVRINVATLIGLMGEPSAIPMLYDMAKSPMRRANVAESMVVQVTIARAIVQLGDLEMLDVIRAQAYSDLVEVRVMAIDMLGELGDRVYIPAFIQMLKDPTVEVRLAAATALVRLGANDGLSQLRKAARFSSEDVAALARKALDETRDPRVRDRFTQLLNNADARQQVASDVRAQAAYGLSFTRDDPSARALVGLMNDPEDNVRLAAAAGVLRAIPRQQTVWLDPNVQ